MSHTAHVETALSKLAAVAVAEDPRVVVARALQAARDVLDMEVAYLASTDAHEQIFAAVDPGDLIAAVTQGGRMRRADSYCSHMIAGTIPSCVPDTAADPTTALLPLTAAGVRSYVGVPVELPGGGIEGTLCCLSRSPDPAVAARELDFMRVLARLVGDQLVRQELVARQQRLRDGVAAMASHDIKTPVSAVIGYAELLESEPGLSDRGREHLGIIRRAGEQIAGLADDLVRVGRSGEPPDERLDFGAVVREAVDMVLPAARDAGVAVEDKTESGLVVRGDRDALLRVAENIIGNAIKYTPAGGSVRIHARADDDHVRLDVVDTGCGIPPEETEQVFESFYRASNGRAVSAGTGLGLAVCRQIVDEHGGDLGLASEVGHGTAVSMSLAAAG